MAFCTGTDVKRILGRDPAGVSQKITFGTTGTTDTMSETDLASFIDEVDAEICTKIAGVYVIPPYMGTGTTLHPTVVKWSAKLTAAKVIRTAYQASVAPDVSVFQAELEKEVYDEIEKYVSERLVLTSTDGKMVAFASYPKPSETHPQTTRIFGIKTPDGEPEALSDDGFYEAGE